MYMRFPHALAVVVLALTVTVLALVTTTLNLPGIGQDLIEAWLSL